MKKNNRKTNKKKKSLDKITEIKIFKHQKVSLNKFPQKFRRSNKRTMR